MTLSGIILLTLLVALTALLAWGAFEDVKQRLIPHNVVFAIAGLWLVFAFLGYGDWQSGLISAGLFLIAGFALFQLNLMGGGDAKLMTAVALWTGMDQALEFAFYTAVAGGFVALAVLVTHKLRPQVAQGEEEVAPTVPYGLAIAFGGAWAVWQSALTEAF